MYKFTYEVVDRVLTHNLVEVWDVESSWDGGILKGELVYDGEYTLYSALDKLECAIQMAVWNGKYSVATLVPLAEAKAYTASEAFEATVERIKAIMSEPCKIPTKAFDGEKFPSTKPKWDGDEIRYMVALGSRGTTYELKHDGIYRVYRNGYLMRELPELSMSQALRYFLDMPRMYG